MSKRNLFSCLLALAVALPAHADAPQQFIVRYKKSAAEARSAPRAAVTTPATGPALDIGLAPVRRLAVGADVVRADRALTDDEATALLTALKADPRVAYAEPDRPVHAAVFPDTAPNDTEYAGQQWHYFDDVGGIDADIAWPLSDGSGVRVAVLDTGITTHPDVYDVAQAGYDFITSSTVAGDGDGRDADPADEGDYCASPASDSSWHGTHVAGTIGAVTNNGVGVAGVAYGAELVNVRVLGRCGGVESDVADAIVWAAGGTVSGVDDLDPPATVINLSLGDSGVCSETYQTAINTAVGLGATVVVAAGNDGVSWTYSTPAVCDNVIVVGATQQSGLQASFSNRGEDILAAPGQDVMSTSDTGTTDPSAASYEAKNGTSMATPHVSGIVALMQSYANEREIALSWSMAKNILRDSARPHAYARNIYNVGEGIVNAYNALLALVSYISPELRNGLAVSDLTAQRGESLFYQVVVPSGATDLVIEADVPDVGDTDLYVSLDEMPTDAVYDCRPQLDREAETCTFATPTAGTYYVRLKGYTTFGGASVVARYAGPSGANAFASTTDVAITDLTTVTSAIVVSGRTGVASPDLRVTVDYDHTYQADLKITLASPSGTVYTLQNYAGHSANGRETTFVVNAGATAANGTWTLRIKDNESGDTGTLNGWSLQF